MMVRMRSFVLLLALVTPSIEAGAQESCNPIYQEAQRLKRTDAWRRITGADSLVAAAEAARTCFEAVGTGVDSAAVLLGIESFALTRAGRHRAAHDRVALFFQRYASGAAPRMLVEMWMRKGLLDHRLGDVAALRTSYTQADRYADALDINERLTLKTTIGQALQNAGQFDQAEGLFRTVIGEIPPDLADEAARLFERTGDPGRSLQARLQQATFLRWHGHDDALHLLDEVALAAHEQGDIRIHGEALRLKTALRQTAGLPVQHTPWRLYPLRDGLAATSFLSLLLIAGYVRRRRRRHTSPNTALVVETEAQPLQPLMLIDVPDYLDNDLKIKVPGSKLQDDDRPFYAVRVGAVTLIAKIYWRIVHY